MRNLLKAMSIAGDLQRFADILDPRNGELRWRLLQEWFSLHPDYHNKLLHCLKLTPAEAVVHLCQQLELDLDALRLMDSTGQMHAQVEQTIALFQELYKERAADNATGGIND